jgi:pimeloyl-ACP methyl ester carboxylesterase
VLLHGFTDSGLCWPDAVRRWRDHYRIVAPDARGHGESPRFDPATSGSNRVDDMVADVVTLLESLATQGGGPPILLGHSMGAGVAATVVATRPDLVRAAVLEDPPWFTRPQGGDLRSVPDTTQQWVQSFRDDLEGTLARSRAESPRWPEIEFGPWGASKAQLDPSLTDREQIARQSPWTDVAAALTKPTLVVTGSRQDAVLVTAGSRQRLADLGNPHCEVEVVPEAGHTVRRDRSDAYHQIVDPWIRKQFAGTVS